MVERVTDVREEWRETVDHCTLCPKTLPFMGHSVTSQMSNLQALPWQDSIPNAWAALSLGEQAEGRSWPLESRWEGCLWLCCCGDEGQLHEHSSPPCKGALDAPWCFQVGFGLGIGKGEAVAGTQACTGYS